MACSIADNTPLKKLQVDLGLPPQCHSLRAHCIQGYESRTVEHTLGLPGTAIGYCQALFNYAGDPVSHTSKVIRLLKEINAPWANSHELFWGHKKQESPTEFVEQAISPLLGIGRVPVLITGLDPAQQKEEIEGILETSPAVQPGETILVRMVVNDKQSIKAAASLIHSLADTCRDNIAMPKWWPLLQGDLNIGQWELLQSLLGKDWRYVNTAVNPFVTDEVLEFLQDNITVAQIPIGLAEGISVDGTIRLAAGIKIMGASDQSSYSILDFVNVLSTLEYPPTLIILGPSLPEWTDVINQERLDALFPILRKACDSLWGGVSDVRRETIWNMSA